MSNLRFAFADLQRFERKALNYSPPDEKEPLRIADFFSGRHSWTKPYGEIDLPSKVFSIDNNAAYSKTTTMIDDFLNLTSMDVIDHLGGYPDVIYSSIPCTTFSIASVSTHWIKDDGVFIPRSDKCLNGLSLMRHALYLIEELKPRWFIIENPRGVLRHMPEMKSLERRTVWFCKYGPTHGILRAKPTDLWGRFPKSWNEQPPCRNGNPECNHVRAPRGSKTGTQGLKDNASRSEIPIELTRSIMKAVLKEWEELV